MTNQFPIHVTIMLCHAQKVHSRNDCVYIYLYHDCTIHTTPSICDKSYNKYKKLDALDNSYITSNKILRETP